MKKNIHPKVYDLSVQCRCGERFKVLSTMKTTLNAERCGACLQMSNEVYKSKRGASNAREKLFENFSISELE